MSPSPESPRPTRAHVLQAIAARFPSEAPATVLGILDQYGPDRHHRERERVHLTLLTLCHGNLDELRGLVAAATRDYRDVLYWAELATGSPDPVADRFTEALLTPEAAPARLALLKGAVPGATRIAVLWQPGYDSHQVQLAELEATARGLAVALQPIEVRRPADLDGAFATMRQGWADAVLVLTSTMLKFHLPGMAERALTSRLPAMGELREFAAAGGLMSYGLSAVDQQARAVGGMERLIRTLKQDPSAEPLMEQPTTLELVINLKTAKALRLTIPPAVLARADQMIR